jgi:serine/threonine protein kinase
MRDAFINPGRETLFLVMDYVEGFTIKNYVKMYKLKHRQSRETLAPAGGLPEDLCRVIMTQLLSAVEYLHYEEVAVCHRDINPTNVMVTQKEFTDQPHVTLIDFNVARKFKDPETNNKLLMMTNTGAFAFTAPEIRQGIAYE